MLLTALTPSIPLSRLAGEGESSSPLPRSGRGAGGEGDGDSLYEPYIEVYSLHTPERTLVTVIEILSPANKSPQSEGRRLYLRKQHDLLNSWVHLLEIDLLHEGAHTVFLPLEALKRVRAEWDYLVCLHRAGWAGREADVWFVDLAEPLPKVLVPLRAPDPDIVVHLQAALEEAYTEGQYHKAVDYTQPPPIPLPPDKQAWVDARLRELGLRS
jgi:hypothetical protein